MRLVLGLLGILAASVGTAQAQYGQNGNGGYQYVPNTTGGYEVFRNGSGVPMGEINRTPLGGYSSNPNPGYRAPPSTDPDGPGFSSGSSMNGN